VHGSRSLELGVASVNKFHPVPDLSIPAINTALKINLRNVATMDDVEKATERQWEDAPFASSLFTSNAGSWTVASGNVETYAYRLDGDEMVVDFRVISTSVAGNPAELRIAIPVSKVARRRMDATYVYDDGTGTPVIGPMYTLVGSTFITLIKITGTWATTTNATGVWGQMKLSLR